MGVAAVDGSGAAGGAEYGLGAITGGSLYFGAVGSGWFGAGAAGGPGGGTATTQSGADRIAAVTGRDRMDGGRAGPAAGCPAGVIAGGR